MKATKARRCTAANLLAVGSLVGSLAACTTTNSTDSLDEGFKLGKLRDTKVRETAYAALEAKLARTENLGDDGQQITELGDDDGFDYRITKMMRGDFELSGQEGEDPTQLDLEVHGWYRRITTGGHSGDSSQECIGFDASTKLLRHEDRSWHVAPGQEPELQREQEEDCF